MLSAYHKCICNTLRYIHQPIPFYSLHNGWVHSENGPQSVLTWGRYKTWHTTIKNALLFTLSPYLLPINKSNRTLPNTMHSQHTRNDSLCKWILQPSSTTGGQWWQWDCAHIAISLKSPLGKCSSIKMSAQINRQMRITCDNMAFTVLLRGRTFLSIVMYVALFWRTIIYASMNAFIFLKQDIASHHNYNSFARTHCEAITLYSNWQGKW